MSFILFSGPIGPRFSNRPLFNGQRFVVDITADVSITDDDHAGRLVQDESTAGATVTFPNTLPEGFTCWLFRKGTGPNTTIAVSRGLIIDGATSLQTGEMALICRRGNTLESVIVKEVAGSTGRRTAGFFGTFLVVSADTTALAANAGTFYVFEGTPAGDLTFNLPAASTLTVGDFFTVANVLSGGSFDVNVTPNGSDRIAGQFGAFDVVPQGSTVSYVLRTDASGSGTIWQRVFDGEQATAPDWPESTDSPVTTATTIDASNYANFQNRFVRGDAAITLPSLDGIPVAIGDGIRFVATTGDFVLTPAGLDTINNSSSPLTVSQGQEVVIYRGTSATDWSTFLVAARDVGVTQGTTTPVSGVASWAGLTGAISGSEVQTELEQLNFLRFTPATINVNGEQITGAVTGDFVRWWLRNALVQPGGESASGTGIRIDEAQLDSFTQVSDQVDGILYLTLPDAFVALGIDGLRVVITRADGVIDQVLSLETDFTEEIGLSAEGTVYRTSSARRGNAIAYFGGDTIALFRTATDTRYTLTNDADVTANVSDLPSSSFDPTARAQIDALTTVDGADRAKLDLFTAESTTTAEAALPDTVDLRVSRVLSNDLSDYASLTPSTGLLPATDGVTTTTTYATVPWFVVNTSWSASVAGAATLTEILPSPLDGRRLYRVDLPPSSDVTNVYTPNGTIETVNDYRVDELVKISSQNLDDALREDMSRIHDAGLDPALADLETHLSVGYTADTAWTTPPNPTSVNATITRVFAAFQDENRTGPTPFTGNNFDDLADPTITIRAGHDVFFADANDPNNVDFPGKPSYFTGGRDVVGAPLTNDFRKIIVFEHYIRNEDFTEDIPLLKAGARRIIGVGPTGLHVRQGRQDGSLVTTTFDERLRPPGGSNTIQYLRGVGAQSIQWFVPATSPNGTTITFPLALTLRPKLVQGGTAGDGVTVAYTITDRDVDQAQTSEVVALPIPGSASTQDETLLLEYNATTNVFTISTAGISTNGTNDVSQIGFEVTYNDSAEVNSSVQSRDVPFGRQDEHRGRTVWIILILFATNPFETSADKFLSVKAVVDGNQENDIDLHFRESAFDFSDLQFGPNTGDQVSMANLQVYDFDTGGEPFNTPTHAELYRMGLRRDEYLGLFRPPGEDYRTYTIDGGLVLTRDDAMDTTLNVIDAIDAITVSGSVQVVYAALNNTTGSDGLVNSVTLPADYADFDFLHVIERQTAATTEWRAMTFSTRMLASGLIGSTNFLRLQGDSDLQWNSATRVLSLVGGLQEISRVELVKV